MGGLRYQPDMTPMPIKDYEVTLRYNSDNEIQVTVQTERFFGESVPV